ncbi:MAG: VWA domain-containing protein [Acidobacteria bacterium]|nr:VWA domain-containing protein [Acidobacteriota bacterium]
MPLPARRVRDATVAVFLAISLLPVSAQDPPPPQSGQVFRGAVDFVRVDAYPRRDGRIVEGLTAADFMILEDGQPQAIDTFEFVRHAADPAYERVDPRNRAEAERWVADPKRRLFIIYLDLYHITRAASHQIRGPLMQVLSESIGPSDVVAVMTPETQIGELAFTQTLNTVAAEIERYWEWGLEDAPVWPRNPAEDQLAACGDGRNGFEGIIRSFRDDVFFTSVESLIAHMGALRQDRTNVILLSEGWRNTRGGIDIRNLNNLPGQSQIPLRPQAGRVPGAGGTGVDQFGRPTTDRGVARPPSCTELLARLQVDYDERFRRLFRLANANNVSFHTIDVGGLRTGAATAELTTKEFLSGRRSPMGNPRVLQELAENTDGVATINANDIGLGLRRVIEHTSSYYLLGYASTNAATDGRYRRIEVRVNQRDVDVTARRGYTAVSDQMQALANARTARAAVAPAVALAIGTLARWDDGRVGAGDEATPTVAAPATPVLGLARLWRIPAIGRPVAQPAGAPIFQRGQRLRIEWQPATTPVAHTVRLLDRRGQTLNPGAAMTAAFDETAGVLRVELHIAALAAGDYAIEVTTGDETERQIVAFRVR